MSPRKDRPSRLYDVLLLVRHANAAGAPRFTSHNVANALGLKPSSYIRGLLQELVDNGSLRKEVIRQSFGHPVYTYHVTHLGRLALQNNKLLRALYQELPVNFVPEEMEL